MLKQDLWTLTNRNHPADLNFILYNFKYRRKSRNDITMASYYWDDNGLIKDNLEIELSPHFSDGNEPLIEIQETLWEMDPYDANTAANKIMQSSSDSLIKKAPIDVDTG